MQKSTTTMAISVFRFRDGSAAGFIERSFCIVIARDLIELLREREIGFRQAAFAVRGNYEPNLIPANVDIGMMIHRFGNFRDTIHETDRRHEIAKFARLHELFFVAFPRE